MHLKFYIYRESLMNFTTFLPILNITMACTHELDESHNDIIEKKTNFNILYLEYPIISNGKNHFHQIKNKFEPNQTYHSNRELVVHLYAAKLILEKLFKLQPLNSTIHYKTQHRVVKKYFLSSTICMYMQKQFLISIKAPPIGKYRHLSVYYDFELRKKYFILFFHEKKYV